MSRICACGGGLVVEVAGLVVELCLLGDMGHLGGRLGGLGPSRCCY